MDHLISILAQATINKLVTKCKLKSVKNNYLLGITEGINQQQFHHMANSNLKETTMKEVKISV